MQENETASSAAQSNVTFDPNSTALAESGLFGLPYSADEAKIHIIPVPWEVTTSYGRGTSLGPAAVLRASHQVDLFDIETGDAWSAGYYMDDISEEWSQRSERLKEAALERLELIESGEENGESAENIRKAINEGSDALNKWVEEQASAKLEAGKIPGLVGGDHSSPFGLIKAIHKKYKGDFGVLHIDAHADLRDAYQGYNHSHASIMHNVVERIGPRCLVQVGIRDFSRGEYDYSESRRGLSGEIASGRIVTHYDRHLKRRLDAGESFTQIANSIIADLPQNVYVSFDIDGLDPALCPNTGTPVPGGLSFDQAATLIAALHANGKRIVGFDLNEVAEPEEGAGEWDANVGARMLFKICGWAAITNGLAQPLAK
ncbi:MAG: agmatinase family protein [Bdellovibrionales bacterium]|jgi:agmatinase|nr:agmatinase family protein [Bdellovibrionales bacterium]